MKAIVTVMPKGGVLDPQGEAVRHLMHHNGYRDIRTLRDLEGHERVTLGSYRHMPI